MSKLLTHSVAALGVLSLSTLALIARSDPGKGDWPMWGGTADRNLVSNMKGLPTSWDIKAKKNIKWVAELGSQAYGNPVVANGVVLVGTNNEAMKDPAVKGDKGILMAFRESDGQFLWQAVHDKLTAGPRQRLAVPGRVLLAARRERDRLLRVQPRRSGGGRHPGLPRQRRERRPVQGREADARDRRRHHLAIRHDGRARRVPAQHGELVAGHAREPDLRQHVERPGREPRQRAVAEVAGDHRARQDDRQARVGGRLAGREDPARTVVLARRRQESATQSRSSSARATATSAATRRRAARSSGSST